MVNNALPDLQTVDFKLQKNVSKRSQQSMVNAENSRLTLKRHWLMNMGFLGKSGKPRKALLTEAAASTKV